MGAPADAAAFFEVVFCRDRVDGAVVHHGTCRAGCVCFRFALDLGTDAAG